MSKLQELKLYFNVADNPELSAATQWRIIALGGYWPNGMQGIRKDIEVLYLDGRLMESNPACHLEYECATLDDLYNLPEPHIITLDGKDREISDEVFEKIQELL